MPWGPTETLVVVRERLNDDNDPERDAGGAIVADEHELTGCLVVSRIGTPETAQTGETVSRVVDVRCPDRDADVAATDRVRRADDPPSGRAEWAVQGEPARSPYPGGAVVFTLAATSL